MIHEEISKPEFRASKRIQERAQRTQRHKVHRLSRFRIEENSAMNHKKEGRRREEARSTPPRSRSTRRSSTIGLESPVPVYGSGVRCFEQQADQVEASGRALDTVFEHARGKRSRRSNSSRIDVVYFVERERKQKTNEVEMKKY